METFNEMRTRRENKIPPQVVAVFVVVTLTRIMKSVVTEQAPVTLERRNNPRENPNQKWYTHYHSSRNSSLHQKSI